MILTIAIPTYNRPEQLFNTVRLLLPQLNNDVKILILDNHSSTEAERYLQDRLEQSSLNKLTIIRHKTNIGADANFARCFEFCDTPYIWTLGDDDQVEPGAVDIILNEIATFSNQDIIGLNLSPIAAKPTE